MASVGILSAVTAAAAPVLRVLLATRTALQNALSMALSGLIAGPKFDGVAAEYWGRHQRFDLPELRDNRCYWLFCAPKPCRLAARSQFSSMRALSGPVGVWMICKRAAMTEEASHRVRYEREVNALPLQKTRSS
jgi:hypothetical protein